MSRAARGRYADGDEEEMSGREDVDNETLSLTQAHHDEAKHNGPNNTLFGSSSERSDRDARSSSGVREGMEVEDDDEEVEIDSDLENELPRGADSAGPAVVEADQPQTCSNWIVLYVLGVVAALGCEFTILLPAFYLRLFLVGLLYGVLWLSFASCAAHMHICPGKRKPHSTLALALYLASLAAGVGGMTGAHYYQQMWRFDKLDSAYWAVDPKVTANDAKMYAPTFLEFVHEPTANLTAYVDVLPVGTYNAANPPWIFGISPERGASSGGVEWKRSSSFCVAPIVATKPASLKPIAYWAVSTDCCDDSQPLVMTCKYWGDNIAGLSPTANLFTLSAEVLEDQDNLGFRDAVEDYIKYRNPGVTDAGEVDPITTHFTPASLLVEVMRYEDHLANQEMRRRKAWIALGSAALGWPILAAVFWGMQALWDMIFANNKKPSHHS